MSIEDETATNDAMYASIKRRAERAGKKVEFRDKPLRNFPEEGVDVYVDGEWRGWFAKLHAADAERWRDEP